jgi:hypothetical protein
MSIFTKIRPAGAELFHADGRTDTAKLTVDFRNFTNAPKKVKFNLYPATKVERGSRR